MGGYLTATAGGILTAITNTVDTQWFPSFVKGTNDLTEGGEKMMTKKKVF